MTANFGTKVDGRKWAIRLNPDVMKNVGTERGNEGDGVSLEVGDAGEKTEEVALNKLFDGDPKLLTTVVDDLILVRVAVDGVSAGGGVEEIGEKVS